jgi:predicted transcriptional regulator
VLRLMQVMHGKGLLRATRASARTSTPRRMRASRCAASLLRELIQKAYAGSGKELVMAALRGHVSAAERAEIQRFLEENE